MKKNPFETSFSGRNKEYWVRTDSGEVVGKFRWFDSAEALALTYEGKSTYNNCDPVQILITYVDQRESIY